MNFWEISTGRHSRESRAVGRTVCHHVSHWGQVLPVTARFCKMTKK